jgi:hypothetical protein
MITSRPGYAHALSLRALRILWAREIQRAALASEPSRIRPASFCVLVHSIDCSEASPSAWRSNQRACCSGRRHAFSASTRSACSSTSFTANRITLFVMLTSTHSYIRQNGHSAGQNGQISGQFFGQFLSAIGSRICPSNGANFGSNEGSPNRRCALQ